jgi:putative FmdB family regulatory protein
MPLYEYKCDRCNEVFEVMQKFSDEPLSVHDNCGGSLEKLLSSPAIQFKGSGWYVTDYARKSGSPAKSNGESSGAKTESKSESAKPAESKPADSKSPAK